jgi:hypothetical protein
MFQLVQNMSTLVQGIMPIATYSTKLKVLLDEQLDLQISSSYTYGTLKDGLQLQHYWCTMMFLMGLNESYGAVHGHVLLIELLPSVNYAYALVLQEGHQCNIRAPYHH